MAKVIIIPLLFLVISVKPASGFISDQVCEPYGEEFERIEEYFDQRLWSVAEQRIQKIIEKEPECYRARVDLGRVYYYRGQDDKALSYFNRLRREVPDRHHPHHYRGIIYYEQGRELYALIEFHMAYEANPTLGSGYFFKTISPLLGRGDQFLTDSIDSLAAVIPDISSVHLTHGLFYYFQEEYDRALEKFKKVVSINGEHAGGWFYSARCYESLGEYTAAMNAYNKAISLSQDYRVAYFQRGMLKIRMGNWNRGCNDLRTADSLEHAGAPMALRNFCRYRFY